MQDLKSLIEIGQTHLTRCQLAKASETFNNVRAAALELVQNDENASPEDYFTAASALLRIHSEANNAEAFQKQLDEIETVLNKAYDSKFLITIENQKGIFEYFKGNFDEALQHITNGLALSKEGTSQLTRAKLNYALAQVFYAQNKFIESHECLNEVFSLLQKNKTSEAKEYVICSYILLGHIRRASMEYEGALEKYWEAHKLLKRINNWYLHYYVLYGISYVYLCMGDLNRASIYSDILLRSTENLEVAKLKSLVTWIQAKINEEFDALGEDMQVARPTESNINFDRKLVLFDMLYILTENPGEVVNKEDFVRRVWKEEYNPLVHDTKIYTNINRLRKLIEPDVSKPKYIICDKDGYKFNSDVAISIN